MGFINRCEASLRLFGDDLIPEEVCRLFGHFPSQAWMVIPLFLERVKSSACAAMASFCFGVMASSAVFGRS